MKIREIRNKTILFITTKNIDYIRNSQELLLLKKLDNQIDVIFSKSNYYLVRIIHIYIKLIIKKVKNYNFIFIGFAPQLILPIFEWKFKCQYVVIDFFISLYDTLVFDRKVIPKWSYLAKILKYTDKITLNFAKHIIVDTNAHLKYFASEFDVDENKFEIMYLEADHSLYYPRVQDKIARLQEKFVVLYFGSMLPLQGIDVVLDAVSQFKNDRKVYFQLIGPIHSKYEKPICENIEYIEWLEQKELATYIANADLCLAGHFSKDIKKADRTIPGKAYIYDAMKKKMILGDSIANREIFKDDKRHHFVKMGDYKDLVKKIQQFS